MLRQAWTGGRPVSSICTDRTDFEMRETDRETDRLRDRETENRETENRETENRETKTERQRNRQTERQRNRKQTLRIAFHHLESLPRMIYNNQIITKRYLRQKETDKKTD